MSEPRKKLPAGWIVTSLGDVVDVLDRFRIPVNRAEREKRAGTTPYYGATGQVGWIHDYIFDQEIILLGEDGAPFLDTLKPKAYMVRGRSWVNNHAHVLVARKGVLNSFLLHQLNCINYREFVSGTTRLKLPQASMLSIPIWIAPEHEQRRIVEEIEKQFTRIEAATAGLRRAQANLKTYRAAVLKAACEGRLVPTEADMATVGKTNYGLGQKLVDMAGAAREKAPLPKGWTWVKVGQISTWTNGKSLPKSEQVAGMFPVLGGNGIIGSHNRSLVNRPGIVVGRVGAQCGNVQLTSGPAGITDNALYSVVESEVVTLEYYRLALSAVNLNSLAKGSGQPFLNQRVLSSIDLAVPPLPEQIKIVSETDRHFSIIDSAGALISVSLTKAESLRNAILRDAFRGKLVSESTSDHSGSHLYDQIHQEHVRQRDWPQHGRGIKPGVLTPGNEPQHPPKPRRGAGNNDRESAAAPSGLPGESGDASLGLKPQALRPGPFRAEPTGGDDVTRERSSQIGKATETEDFLGLPREEQVDQVWESLLGRGAVEKDEAIRIVANDLRENGLAQFQRLRQDGALYEAIASAITRGARAGSFDRPQRGHERALLPVAREYTQAEWRLCLLESLNQHAIEEEDALRAAAEWARENMGLEFSRLREDGVILRGLRDALQDVIERGEIQRKHGQIHRALEKTGR